MSFRSFCAALAALGLLSFCSLVQADVIYRETFGRPAGAVNNVSTFLADWARFNAAGTLPGNNGVSADGTGKPIDVANVNAGPNIDLTTFDAQPEGWSFQDGTIRLSMTNEYSFNPADYTPGSVVFRWHQGNGQINSVDQASKLAIRIGTQWYASVANYTNPQVSAGANFGLDPGGAVQVSHTFDPAAANWLLLSFDGIYTPGATPGTGTSTASTVALALGASPISDLSGPITAFGLYRDVTGVNARFDSFTIEAIPVPEPATWLLGAMAGCASVALRRRESAG